MLFVLINWGYMTVTFFCLGIGFSAFCKKVLNFRIQRMRNLMFVGIVLATVYAESFSLIGRVNVEANLILCAGCLIMAFFLRDDIKERMREESFPNLLSIFLFFCGLFLPPGDIVSMT